MAILSIVHYPDERLRTPATPVREPLPNFDNILEDMIDTMYAKKGIGLAANQVGLPWHIAIIDHEAYQDPKNPRSPHLAVYLNAKIVSSHGRVDSQEGCLSIPDYRDTIKRSKEVTVSYHDRFFNEKVLKADGLLAIVLQHEIDHLNGKLYVDRLSSVKRDLFRRKYGKAT